MSDFHVYGLGNALVDTEYEVNDEFLEGNLIEKGVMTLVGEQAKDELTARLNQSFSVKRHTGGGSAANTIVAVAQFGGRAFYSCRVADDELGLHFRRDLLDVGVETNPNGQHGVTGQCLVMITPDAERTMNTFLGISSGLSIAELSPEALKRSRFLYIEGYLVSSHSALEAALEARTLARAASVPVALTLSDPSMVTHFRSEFDGLLKDRVDLLFCNKDEALIYTATDRIEDAAAILREKASRFSITLGAAGALIYDGDAMFNVPAAPTRAIDTNGAGDIFAGAFLYALAEGWSCDRAAVLANRAAARLVRIFGPRLEKSDQQMLLHEFNDD